jgi:hypothetical protein
VELPPASAGTASPTVITSAAAIAANKRLIRAALPGFGQYRRY